MAWIANYFLPHEACIELSEVRMVLGMWDVIVWLVVLAMVMSDEETKVELKQFSDYLRNKNKIVK